MAVSRGELDALMRAPVNPNLFASSGPFHLHDPDNIYDGLQQLVSQFGATIRRKASRDTTAMCGTYDSAIKVPQYSVRYWVDCIHDGSTARGLLPYLLTEFSAAAAAGQPRSSPRGNPSTRAAQNLTPSRNRRLDGEHNDEDAVLCAADAVPKPPPTDALQALPPPSAMPTQPREPALGVCDPVAADQQLFASLLSAATTVASSSAAAVAGSSSPSRGPGPSGAAAVVGGPAAHAARQRHQRAAKDDDELAPVSQWETNKAVEELQKETSYSMAVVVHALIVCSGKTKIARRYLRGESVDAADLWAPEEDDVLMSSDKNSIGALRRRRGRDACKARAQFLQN